MFNIKNSNRNPVSKLTLSGAETRLNRIVSVKDKSKLGRRTNIENLGQFECYRIKLILVQ